MKAKVIIENGKSKIILTPENKFEKRLIKDIYEDSKTYEINTYPDADYNFSEWSNHKLVVTLKTIS